MFSHSVSHTPAFQSFYPDICHLPSAIYNLPSAILVTFCNCAHPQQAWTGGAGQGGQIPSASWHNHNCHNIIINNISNNNNNNTTILMKMRRRQLACCKQRRKGRTRRKERPCIFYRRLSRFFPGVIFKVKDREKEGQEEEKGLASSIIVSCFLDALASLVLVMSAGGQIFS